MEGSMKEITFFGRGGQGAVVGSEIMAEAYFREGRQVQSFPSFGVERRGAPVMAFLRVDNEFIYLRSQIYKAQLGLVFSADIMQGPNFKPMLADNAQLIVNASDDIKPIDGIRIARIDATAIAREHKLGSTAQPLVNSAMLGAFAKVAGDITLDNLLGAVEVLVPQHPERNLAAVEQAYNQVVLGE